jgi:hypothetical protein
MIKADDGLLVKLFDTADTDLSGALSYAELAVPIG